MRKKRSSNSYNLNFAISVNPYYNVSLVNGIHLVADFPCAVPIA